MIDKRVAGIAEALEGIGDGASVMLGGFGAVGQPDALIEGLIERGVRDLSVIANNAGIGKAGLARLLAGGHVRKITCSYPRAAGSVVFAELFRSGRIVLELVPQGTLAERIRAGGAGIPAFYTPVAHGTELADGRDIRVFDGRPCVLEEALRADVALLQAWRSDRWGNLVYRGAGRNFNAVMAPAATLTVVEAVAVVELGALDPEQVATPGVFVDRVVVPPVPSVAARRQAA